MPKKKQPKIVPPRGPATNLRKAGTHEDKRRKNQEQIEKNEHELDDLTAIGEWAFDEDV
ncbi:MAG TPA: hypothetical protein VHR97_03440 [Candidatus Baltobacteraceae bacterium]|jgi:hypothetical protein|nr:hypothetical protein [Candidatus Baltobacteraceae bacterium]